MYVHHAVEAPCPYCKYDIKVRAGIVDTMKGAAPYNDPEVEFELTCQILKWSENLSFPEVVTKYIHDCTDNSLEIKNLAINNRQESVKRGARMLWELEEMSDRMGFEADGTKENDLGVLLDFGCGVGGQLVASAARSSYLIGIDAALTELALARRNLLDHERDQNVRLIACYAEKLPLPRCSVDTIIMRDTIEHFKDQQKALREAWRVLKPGGRLLLNSPNRYMMWYPEPHVQLYMMGFMPRKMMPWYVAKRLKTSYTGCRLLGLGELMKFVKRLNPKPHKMVWKGNPPVGAQCPLELEWAEDFVMSPEWNNKPVFRWFSPEHTILLKK